MISPSGHRNFYLKIKLMYSLHSYKKFFTGSQRLSLNKGNFKINPNWSKTFEWNKMVFQENYLTSFYKKKCI